MPRDNILFCGGVIIVLKVLLLSFMVSVMIREFGHFEKKKTFLSLCVNKITVKMTLYHIELTLNYKHLQKKTQKQRLHCICKKSKYVLNRFPFIHSCSEIVDLKNKTHHELCFIKHGMNINFSKKSARLPPNVIILNSKYGNVFATVYLCSLASLISVLLTFRLCLNQCVTR